MFPRDRLFQSQLARTYRLLALVIFVFHGGLLVAAGNSDLLGQRQAVNNQYCFYQETDAGYRLLTPHSLARDDLLAAARSESVNMSKAFNFVSWAIFPAGVACGSTGLMWLGMRKMRKRFGHAVLLSCAAVAALAISAKHAIAEEDAGLQQALDTLLAGEQQPNRYRNELLRVMQWLGSDNYVVCPPQPDNSPS
ncbi:MAG: hypothetical protein OYH77_06500 [Pseudomonadota bacterium]|nr:hypothetical protein [Pseudomonadota bacterium]